MNLVDEFGKDDRGKNEARRIFASTKGPPKADYLSFNHVSHFVSNIVSNFAKNISNYLIPDAKKASDQLRQAFTKASIFQHFGPEQYIQVETEASGQAIGEVLSQLTNDLGQWHLVAYFLPKMISVKTWYKTYDGELLAIVEAFKICRDYLKSCKHEVFILSDYNNLYCFIDMKSLSSCQVRWAQKLSKYHFWIDYCQGKANGAANALSRFSQWDNEEKTNLWAKNTWILYCLQFSPTNASISGLNTMFLGFLPQHQVFIWRIYALPQLWRFWSILQTKLANEQPYEASISSMRLRLQKLQEANRQAQKLRQQKANSYKKIDEILHYQGLPFKPKSIQTELISCHHNDPLAGYFGIRKTCKLLAQKYCWPPLRHNVKAYVKGCDVCLASKAVCHKPYDYLQLLPIPTHRWKNLLMDFVTGLPVSIN